METKTTKYLCTVCKYLYLCTLPNFWSGRLDLPDWVTKSLDRVDLPNSILITVLIISEYGSYFTQQNLSGKQVADCIFFCVIHSVIYGCNRAAVAFSLDLFKKVVHSIAFSLKKDFNDRVIEEKMIKRSNTYAIIFIVYMAAVMASYFIDTILRAIRTGSSYTVFIPIWPDVNDSSLLAGLASSILNTIFLLMVLRVASLYILILVLTICLSHQYKNLQSYFYSLNQIFENDLDQTAKEDMYETSLKIGLKLHANILGCTKVAEKAFQIVFCGQLFMCNFMLTGVLIQMVMTERTLFNVIASVNMAASVLFGTGMFMWNAGDITVEASLVPDAMYGSGWEHCRGTTGHRVRRLLIKAIEQGQSKVVLKVFGVFELSYAAYITVVKSSYSVFSVIY